MMTPMDKTDGGEGQDVVERLRDFAHRNRSACAGAPADIYIALNRNAADETCDICGASHAPQPTAGGDAP